MPIRTTFSTDGETSKRLKAMVKADHSKMSSFLTWLINEEWDRRHAFASGIKEAADRLPAVDGMSSP